MKCGIYKRVDKKEKSKKIRITWDSVNRNEKESAEERKKERERQTDRRYQPDRTRESMTIIEKLKRIDFIASLSHDCLFFFFFQWTEQETTRSFYEREVLSSSNTLWSPPIHRWHFNDDQYLRLFLFEKFLFEAERKRFDNRFCNIRKLLENT